ncbi:MAG: hypothetical protein KatS3mg100_126 [Candidatus Parcubacteria bacterium]|nr:MAG: hypothetical protein KatS3mg100_126 [Candidatus Parcubacteria bacterium]
MNNVWRNGWVHIARWGVVLSLGAALATPLLVADSLFFPYITGKNFAFRVLVDIAAACWLLIALVDPRYRPRWSASLAVFAALVGWMVVADAMAPNAFKAFFSNFERMEGWIGFAHTFLFFLTLVGFIEGESARRGNERDWWWIFWHISMAVSVVVAMGAIGDYLNYLKGARTDPRVFSTLGNATYLAAYALFHIFIALLYLVREQRWGWRAAYLGFIALQLFALYHTATRGAILGLLGGLGLTSLLWAVGGRSRALRASALAVLAGAAIVVGGVWLARESSWVRESPVLQRFATISLSEGTVAARFMVWRMALEGARERPLFGWGQEGFNYVFNKHYNPKMYNQEQWFDRAHNVFLDWLIAGGVPAFVLYLLFYGSALWLLWAPTGRAVFSLEERSVLTGLIAAYGFHNIFVFDNLTSYILFALLLAWITQKTATARSPRVGGERAVAAQTAAVVAAPVALVFLLALLWFHSVGIATARQLVAAIADPRLPAQERLNLLQRAHHHWNIGGQEVAEQAQQIAYRLRDGRDPETPQAFLLARDLLKQELARAPNDARLWLFYASLLEQIGDTARAQEAYQKALAASPNKQQFLFAYASFFIITGRLDNAEEVLQRAYELEPSYDEAARNRAAIMLLRGKDKEAEAFLLAHTGGDEQEASKLFVAALEASGRWEDAARARESALGSSSDAQAYLGAAEAWLRAGNVAKAREVLQRMQTDLPSAAGIATAALQQVDALASSTIKDIDSYQQRNE